MVYRRYPEVYNPDQYCGGNDDTSQNKNDMLWNHEEEKTDNCQLSGQGGEKIEWVQAMAEVAECAARLKSEWW